MRIGRRVNILCIALGLTLLFAFSCRRKSSSESTLVKSHSINIELFPEAHAFKATDKMRVEHNGKSLFLYLNKSFRVNSILVNRKRVDFRFADLTESERAKLLIADSILEDISRAGRIEIFAKPSEEYMVIIDYEGKLFEEPAASQFSRDYIADQTAGLIGEKGTFLSPESFWYPNGDEKEGRFEVVSTTPAGYETITQGTRLRREMNGDRLITQWKNDHPSDALYLQAGPYEVREGVVDGIKVYTYFFKGGDKLASLYLSKSIQYLKMYNTLLGHYPYDKFAVVENFFETGYGLPSWTLLGGAVLRLPFIPDTSLPHEICHNWWGNGVFVDYTQGNWCEGLTVYCADYLLKKSSTLDGELEYRRQINRDYASYVKENDDFPLTEFRSRHNPAERAIGYGKSMMVFHALECMVGEENFFKSMKRLMTEYMFKTASWRNVLEVFEKECGIDLDMFYTQWVERTGAPSFQLSKVREVRKEKGFLVSFTLIQDGEPYELNVPVEVTTINSKVRMNVELKKESEEFEMFLEAKPFRLEIDPDHHLFRRLHPEEIPPSIAKVFGSESQFIVMGSKEDGKKSEEYRIAAEMINKTRTGIIKADTEITKDELNSRSLIVLGTVSEETQVAEFLRGVQKSVPWEGVMAEQENAAQVIVFDHPGKSEFGVMLIRGNSGSDILSVVQKLPHYGKYSYLLFHGSTNVEKGIWEVEKSPLIYLF